MSAKTSQSEKKRKKNQQGFENWTCSKRFPTKRKKGFSDDQQGEKARTWNEVIMDCFKKLANSCV